MTSGSTRWKLILAFVAVYIIWGSTYLGIRYAIETIPPMLMAGTRFLIAGSILFGISLWRSSARPSRIHWRTATILGFLLLFCGNGGVTVAEKQIASGMAALLVTSEPLWVVILNWIRPSGHAPSTREVIGVIAGFGGVALLLAPQLQGATNGGIHGTNLFASVLVIGAAFAWAAGSLYGINAPAVEDRPMANGMTMLAGGALMFLAGLANGDATRLNIHQISATSIAALMYLVIFGALIAFSAYTYLMRNTTPAKASTYAFVNPVVAVLLGWGIAGEPLDAASIIAIPIIVGAVILITFGKGGGLEPARDFSPATNAHPELAQAAKSVASEHSRG